MHFYFVEFTPERRYGSKHGEMATMMGHYLHGLEGDYTAYFFGAPRIYWRFGTMGFLAPDVAGQDVLEPLKNAPTFVDEDRQSIFVSLPERVDELEWVRTAYPGGEVAEFHDQEGVLQSGGRMSPHSE